MKRDQAIQLIVTTVTGYLESCGHSVATAIEPTTKLYGTGGALDSLGLVAILVELEQRLADEMGVTVPLMDDRAMSQSRSPFRTADALADYVVSIADGANK